MHVSKKVAQAVSELTQDVDTRIQRTLSEVILTVIEQQGTHHTWQANTTRHRRVLSRFVLGLLSLQSSEPLPIEKLPWQRALQTLQHAWKLLHLQPLSTS